MIYKQENKLLGQDSLNKSCFKTRGSSIIKAEARLEQTCRVTHSLGLLILLESWNLDVSINDSVNLKSFILQAWSRWESVPLVTIRRRSGPLLSDYQSPQKRPETGIEPLTFLLDGRGTEIFQMYLLTMLFQWSISSGTGIESFSTVRVSVCVLVNYCPFMPALFLRGYTRGEKHK